MLFAYLQILQPKLFLISCDDISGTFQTILRIAVRIPLT